MASQSSKKVVALPPSFSFSVFNNEIATQSFDAQAVLDAAHDIVRNIINGDSDPDLGVIEEELCRASRLLTVAHDLLDRLADSADVNSAAFKTAANQ